MEFELSIRVGDKAFGGQVTIKDWHKAPTKEAKEAAVKMVMDNLYKQAISEAIEEATSD